MMMQPTIDKLHALRLPGMARAFEEQNVGGSAAGLSFEDRFGLLVDREYGDREEKRTQQRLKKAGLKQQAYVEDTNYRHPRNLDKGVFQDLATCRWIKAHRNVVITGATGLGKTWLACALAHRACRQGLTSGYHRIPRLLHQLAVARADGSFLRLLAQLKRLDVLVLDDWALTPLAGQGQHDILEVIDDRADDRSTIITSQVPIANWHDSLGDPTIADALMDRILASATRLELKGETMRKERKQPE